MKDFYDILFLAMNHQFNIETLKNAVITTFERRNTDINNCKLIFRDEFKNDKRLQEFWIAFINRSKLSADTSFEVVVTKIESFIAPMITEKCKTWNPTTFIWE